MWPAAVCDARADVDARSMARIPFAKRFRGSRRRARRITINGSVTWELWVVVAWILFLLIVVVPLILERSGR
jgi:hypothetical protein